MIVLHSKTGTPTGVLFAKASPVLPSRTQSYRDKKDHSSSRRGGFDRPSYDRKSDRPAYEGPSMFGGRVILMIRRISNIVTKYNFFIVLFLR